MRKISLFIAMSLDGYIADNKGGVNWLQGQGNDNENIDTYAEFIKNIDTILMGWNTYYQIVTELSPDEWIYNDFTTYVFTHNKHACVLPGFHTNSLRKESSDTKCTHADRLHECPSPEKIQFTNRNPVDMIKQLKEENGKDVWICGGANLVQQLVNKDLIDLYCITVIPTLLGSGIRLFENTDREIRLRLLRTQSYNGMTDLIYTRR